MSSYRSNIDTTTYNYPPFKYLIESATMGSVNSFISSLKVTNKNINTKVSNHFGIGNFTVFKNYLDRLNEVRNRVAHGGRIFNRTFRSARGIGKFKLFRQNINNHKSLDVYLFLHYMLNQLENYKNFEDFKRKKISKEESFMLIKKYSKRDVEKIKKIIIQRMSS